MHTYHNYAQGQQPPENDEFMRYREVGHYEDQGMAL